MTIPELKSIDLVSIVESAGFELRKVGNRFVGMCPFHVGKSPAFYVYPSTQTFYCFGCGEHGDVINFIRKLHGVDFKEALTILGIDTGAPSPETVRKIKKAEHNRHLMTAFAEWEWRAVDEIQTLIRCAYKLIRDIKTLEDMDNSAFLIHAVPVWEYHLSILLNESDSDRLKLFEKKIYG